MRNVLGNLVTLTLFGESHGEIIGATVDGLPAGIKVDYDFIDKCLAKRRPNSATDTARVEKDEYKFISGIFNGFSTGAPITVIIPNTNINSTSYEMMHGKARPSHADYAAHIKYGGFEDYRGGGHFSGRLTTPIVAVGALCLSALNNVGIKIGTHILKCGEVCDRDFSDFDSEFDIIDGKNIPVIDDIESAVTDQILKAKQDLDSVGGIIQTAITNLPVGLGEPWFSSMEGALSNAMFSIGGIKGIEFGGGFERARCRGSEFNDSFRYIDGKVITTTNNNGGINGGITNAMPVVFNCAVKPTPSIAKTQQTIDFINKQNIDLQIQGRHDPAIIKRICIVATSLSALVITDMLAVRYGVDFLN